jgi:glycine dehydrogenase subunit 1
MALIGRQGIGKLARLCFDKSQYLAHAIDALDGYSLPFGYGFAKEMVVKTPVPAAGLAAKAATEGIFAGLIEWQGETLLQIAVTEKRTRQHLDALVAFLADAVK